MSLELVMYRGDDREFLFTLTADSVPVDLTGSTIVFTARKAISDTTPTLLLSTTDGDIAIDPDQAGAGAGKMVLTIPAADTVALSSGTYLCDVEVTDSGGIVRTWPDAIYGESTLIRLRLKADVTRP